MKVIIVALALVALAAAERDPERERERRPRREREPVEIVIEEFDREADGGFYSRFETGNGINQLMTGEVKEVRNEKNELLNIIVIRGSYSYPKADGSTELIKYYGDETGFHAEGNSIPKVPGTSSAT